MSDPQHHVHIKRGDATPEVEAALARLQARGLSREAAGFHKVLFVTRADQTVLMTEGRDSALSAELRGKPGWVEPGDEALE